MGIGRDLLVYFGWSDPPEPDETPRRVISKARIAVAAVLAGTVTGGIYGLIGSTLDGGLFFGFCMAVVSVIGNVIDRRRAINELELERQYRPRSSH